MLLIIVPPLVNTPRFVAMSAYNEEAGKLEQVRRRHPMIRRTSTFENATLILTAGLLLLCGSGRAVDRDAPPTATHDVLDTYFDMKVEDPYRWLENADDAGVKRWSAAQD